MAMYCMKCGRETSGDQTFCQDCLLEMEKYPVEPGTVVQLPRRNAASSPRKNSRRRAQPLEEQVAGLTKRVRVLSVLLALSLLLAAVLAVPAARYYLRSRLRPGQNYTAITSTTTPVETTEDAPAVQTE